MSTSDDVLAYHSRTVSKTVMILGMVSYTILILCATSVIYTNI